MSRMFDQIKKWYENGNWDISRVRQAVQHGKITAEEYTLITGEAYSA